jgi:hypothetical protein
LSAALLCAPSRVRLCRSSASSRAPAPAAIPDFSANGALAGRVLRGAAHSTDRRTLARTVQPTFHRPASGPGPGPRDDPLHPYVTNEVSRVTGKQPSFRVANIDNPNLKPWVVDELKKGQWSARNPAPRRLYA